MGHAAWGVLRNFWGGAVGPRPARTGCREGVPPSHSPPPALFRSRLQPHPWLQALCLAPSPASVGLYSRPCPSLSLWLQLHSWPRAETGDGNGAGLEPHLAVGLAAGPHCSATVALLPPLAVAPAAPQPHSRSYIHPQLRSQCQPPICIPLNPGPTSESEGGTVQTG